MKVNMEVLSPIKRFLSVEVGSEQVGPKLEAAYQQYGRKASIPGFRKGKIPRSVLQLHFRKEIEEEVIRELIAEAYLEAAKETEIRPVGPPEVDGISLEPDQSLRFNATVEVKPDLEVEGYFGLDVLKKPVEVNDEEVDQALKLLQDRTSQFIPMEGWPALEGDLLYIDLNGFINKKTIKELTRENHPVILGSRALLSELEAALFGMQKDEVKDVEVILPPDFIKRDLAGKKAQFQLRIREIKKKKVPELNDDFPKEIGEEGTLEDLKKKLKEDLHSEKEEERDSTLKEEILGKLREMTPFEAPPSLVEEESEHLLKSARQSLAARRATLQDLDLDEASLRQRLQGQAEKRVRNSLILESIALKENVEPSEEEIQKELEGLSASLREEPAKLRRYLEERDGLAQVKAHIRERKTLDLLFEKANIITGDRIVLA